MIPIAVSSCGAWRRVSSARRYYRFSLAVGVVGAVTLLLTLAAVMQAVAITLPPAGEFADACQRFMAVVTWPAILVISLASLGAACCVRGLRAVGGHQRSQRGASTATGGDRR